MPSWSSFSSGFLLSGKEAHKQFLTLAHLGLLESCYKKASWHF